MHTLAPRGAVLLTTVDLDLHDVFEHPHKAHFPADVPRWIRSVALPEQIKEQKIADAARNAAFNLWLLTENKLKQGIQLKLYLDRREIRFFGAMSYLIFDQGRDVRCILDDVGNKTFEANIYVESPLPRPDWVPNILIRQMPDWRLALRKMLQPWFIASQSSQENDALLSSIESWSKALVCRLTERYIDRRALRELLRTQLAIDPVCLRFARRFGLGKGHSGGISNTQLREVALWRHHLLETEAVAPGLLNLVWLEKTRWKNDITTAAPLRDIRENLRKRGVTPAGWKHLCLRRAGPVWRHWYAKRIDGRVELKKFLADWAQLHARLPDHVQIPAAMWEGLARTYLESDTDVLHPAVRWPCHPRVLLEAISAFETAKILGRGRLFIEGDWSRVVRWAADYSNGGIASMKRTWSGALKAATADERRIRARAEADTSQWGALFPEVRWENYRLIPLCNATDLAEEAIALKHCADNLDRKRLGNELHLFSLRSLASDKRIATVAFERIDGDIKLREIRGTANSSASPTVIAAVQTMLERGLAPARRNLARKRPSDTRGSLQWSNLKKGVAGHLGSLTDPPEAT